MLLRIFACQRQETGRCIPLICTIGMRMRIKNHAGNKPNIVPNYAELCYYIRAMPSFCAICDTAPGEVAGMVGFDNPQYFTRIFKEMTGIVPSEYRSRICPHDAEP